MTSRCHTRRLSRGGDRADHPATTFCLNRSGNSRANRSGGGGYGRDRRTSLGVDVRLRRALLRLGCALRVARLGAGSPVGTGPSIPAHHHLDRRLGWTAVLSRQQRRHLHLQLYQRFSGQRSRRDRTRRSRDRSLSTAARSRSAKARGMGGRQISHSRPHHPRTLFQSDLPRQYSRRFQPRSRTGRAALFVLVRTERLQ